MSTQQPKPSKPAKSYQGNGFTIDLYDDWQDKTVYSITAL